MSPRGKPLTQVRVRELAAGPGVVIVCGRFEGVDQRVIDARGLEEVSVGDFILSGGEPAALVLLDAVVRLLPGVMGNDVSGDEESFENGLLEHPHYTRPQEFEGRQSPRSDLGQSREDRRMATRRSGKLTKERRPDLFAGLRETRPDRTRAKNTRPRRDKSANSCMCAPNRKNNLPDPSTMTV